MTLGLTTAQFVAAHVAISLVAIIAGLAALPALARGKSPGAVLPLFIWTTVATVVTGFLFPFTGATPAFATGIVTGIVLAISLAARHTGVFGRAAPRVFAVGATASLWLNMFVLVVQAFQKLPALNALAPTGTEPPFLAAQGLVLLGNIGLGIALFRRAGRTLAGAAEKLTQY
ncbi:MULTISPECIES: hypothetical protein [unclassified Novosphingobium]|uniref:hypothetical protein n=1 Tax=unclassified Novosphingobium TaxID=2644732 RepID=UPI0013599788|nr:MULTISPECIES: hypothetical protein [unclassified Novosphingobium]